MSEIDENKIYFTEKQIININKEQGVDKVLDIGGGGESIIAHLYGSKVISIDLSKEELLEAEDNEALKIIMDARNMDFLDNQFDLCTSFFTFMYLEKSDYEKVSFSFRICSRHNSGVFSERNGYGWRRSYVSQKGHCFQCR